MKIICSLATFQGRESSLERVIESIKKQTVQPTEVFVYDNKVLPDIADNGKFWFLSQLKEPVIYFSMDDDLVYPVDYIKTTLKALEKSPDAVITYHGKLLDGVGLNYYKHHTRFRCLDSVVKDATIDVAGTGVSCFRTDKFNPTHIWRHADRKMADLLLSHYAAQQGVKIICKKHNPRWITHTHIDLSKTIAEQEKHNCVKQNAYADLIYEINESKRNNSIFKRQGIPARGH